MSISTVIRLQLHFMCMYNDRQRQDEREDLIQQQCGRQL